MLKNFSIENWILGGTSFVLIFTLGCYLWFQNEIASIEHHYADYEVETQRADEPSETPLIDISDKEEADIDETDNSDAKDIDNKLSDVTATQNESIENDKTAIYVSLRFMQLVLN